MNVSLFIQDLRQTPAKYLIPKFFGLIEDRLKKSADYRRSMNAPTFRTYPNNSWNRLFSQQSLDTDSRVIGWLASLFQKYIRHEFIPYGSTWKDFSYTAKSEGFEGINYPNKLELIEIDKNGQWLEYIVNENNLYHSKKLWKWIMDFNPDYNPIDWSRDLRSGYRYPSKDHFTRIQVIAPKTGVDVKCAWDLGRMQQLPGMALFALGMDQDREMVKKEILSQIMDFQLQNPPEFGVHWTSAMEVSIRLLNLCVTMDLLVAGSLVDQNDEVYTNIRNYLLDHLSFAHRYREHKNGLSNNHYLANLVGIMFGIHSLNDQHWKNQFGEIAIEFIKEVDKQFLSDGGNFESSVPYHFFSTEISALGMAIINKNRPDLLESSKGFNAIGKLNCALQFCEDVIIEEGRVPQIGDNDSARMLYFFFEMDVDRRDQLNYSSSVNLVKGLFEEGGEDVHSRFIEGISQYKLGRRKNCEFNFNSSKSTYKYKYSETSEYIINKERSVDYSLDLKCSLYPDFGIVLFKNKHIYLLVNGTNRHVKQYWPHGHNDKLSIELWVDGKAIVRDPGTYTYTGSSKLRNYYRSTKAHATIQIDGEEQNKFLAGLQGVFRMIPSTRTLVRNIGENWVEMDLKFKGVRASRKVSILSDRVTIEDFCNTAFTVNKYPEIRFSDGYGSLEIED